MNKNMTPKGEQKGKKKKENDRYFEGIGRRKTAVARVRIRKGRGKFSINDKELNSYFSIERHIITAQSPLTKLKLQNSFDVSVKVKGGGVSAQAEAVRHGLSRALVLYKQDLKPQLKKLGFLRRDPRMVERKKYGLKKARRAPQWSKR